MQLEGPRASGKTAEGTAPSLRQLPAQADPLRLWVRGPAGRHRDPWLHAPSGSSHCGCVGPAVITIISTTVRGCCSPDAVGGALGASLTRTPILTNLSSSLRGADAQRSLKKEDEGLIRSEVTSGASFTHSLSPRASVPLDQPL